MLYAYCGQHRKGDIAQCLHTLASHVHVQIVVEEIDLCRGGDAHDLSNDDFVESLEARIKNHEYDALATPPCNTHSRAAYANTFGPQPLRPLGYPLWLTGSKKGKVELANELVQVAFNLAAAALEASVGYLSPEDLGIAKLLSPASIWQLESCHPLAERTSATTAAFFQCPK